MVLPMLALTVASVIFVAVAFSMFSIHASTPEAVVFKQAIIDSSGDQLNPESLGLSGNPFT